MRTEQAGPVLGAAGCVATVVALAVPYLLHPAWGAELWSYYTGGALGAVGALYILPICFVVFLAGARGRTDPTTAAGIALALGVVAFLVAVAWVLSASLDPLYGFPATWVTDHRWVVLGTTALVPLGAGLYARAVL